MDAPPEDPFLKPWIREARGALQALQRGKIEAALDLADQIPKAPEDSAAWRAYTHARISERGGDPETAVLSYIRGATLCDAARQASTEADVLRRLGRLKAVCYQQLGALEVGRERFEHALRAYEEAERQRAEHGTPAECWETASAQAAAHRAAGAHEAALQAALASVELAETVPQQSERLSGQSWFALALSLLALGRFRETVGATTNARTYWVQEGQTQAVARVLEVEAKALFRWAAATRKSKPDAARARLAEARNQLETAAGYHAESGDAEAAERCSARAARLAAPAT